MSPQAALFDPVFLAFNQLPSRSLHPSRHADYLGDCPVALRNDDPRWEQIWHRHWSRAILERLGLSDRPVMDPALPSLPLALLSTERLTYCMRGIGALLCGPRIRRAISGPEVRALLGTLGADIVGFVRGQGASVHKGLADTCDWSMEQTLDSIDALGRGGLLMAFNEDGPELALRAELKLPAGPAVDAPLAPRQLLAVGLNIAQLTGRHGVPRKA